MNRRSKKNLALGGFDEALPAHLVSVTQDTARPLNLHTNQPAPLSPFVVKLERRGAVINESLSRALELANLAASLQIDYDTDDEAETVDNTDLLSVSLSELSSQFRETDRAPGATPIFVTTAKHDRALPVAFLDSEPVIHGKSDLVSEFMVAREPSVEPKVSLAEALDAFDDMEIPVEVTMASDPEAEDSQYPELEPKLSRFSRFEITFFSAPWKRALAGFIGLSFVLVLPLHAMQALGGTRQGGEAISAAGEAAIYDFTRGTQALADKQFTLAKDDFSRAAERFTQAENSLESMEGVAVAAASVIPQTDRTVTSARGLITAGKELSQTAKIMSDAAQGISSQTSLTLVGKLNLLSTYVEGALPHAQAAANALSDVDPALVPEAYRSQVAELKAKGPLVAASMGEFLTFVDRMVVMLGGEQTMRYLAAFQNNTEIRPTGGFVGSFAEVAVQGGAIENLRIPGGGTYDVQGQLKEFVAAPGPLQLVSARWEFQDANWFPDFPTSARKMQWFYEKAGGPTTDGVIAVNASFMVKLLEILGPVEMPEYGRTIDAENFLFETQKIVELEYDKVANTPKAFIGDLAPKLIDRLTKADLPTLLSVMHVVERGLREKDILLSFTDNDLQSTAEKLGWTGSLKQTTGDYLMLVNTNIGGGKTDGVIDQNVQVDVDVQDDGSVENTVTVTKIHHGLASALFAGRNNVDYLRLYVPHGSTLLVANGFEAPKESAYETSDVPLKVDEDLALTMSELRVDAATGLDTWTESGKTVFGGFMQTAPGETEIITVRYKLPFTVFEESPASGLVAQARDYFGLDSVGSYSLFVQKQPGIETRQTNVALSLPPSWKTAWTSYAGENGGAPAVDTNEEDVYLGWLLEKE